MTIGKSDFYTFERPVEGIEDAHSHSVSAEQAYYSREMNLRQIFELFFDDDMLKLIIQQLVMYACQPEW